MKLNYYTYTITSNDTGEISKPCIKDILDIYCKLTKDQGVLEKTNEKTSKKLYFAKASSFTNIFYLMVPASLNDYRSLNKNSGTIKDLQTILQEGDSLEKITYVYVDHKIPVVGVTSSLGGASGDDLQFYLNEVINSANKENDPKYSLSLTPLQSHVTKANASKLKFISEAKVLLKNETSIRRVFDCFINDESSKDNVEIEIRLKRTGTKIGIEDSIAPLLALIEKDEDDNVFTKVHLRAKKTDLEENIKDYFLDHSMIIYDIINPYLKAKIEDQIETKRWASDTVNTAYTRHFEQFGDRISDSISCEYWPKLLDRESYDEAITG